MENCMCRAPYGGWSSESILLQGKIMSPECICLYSVQVRKEGSYFPCLAGMQIVESKTPFTPPQGGWKRPLFLRQEVAVWLPPYLYPADHKMHCLCLEHPNKSSKVTLKIRLSIQTTIRTYSQLKGHHKPNTLVCFVQYGLKIWLLNKTPGKLRLSHMRWMQREQTDCNTHYFLSKTEKSIPASCWVPGKSQPNSTIIYVASAFLFWCYQRS